MSLIPSRDHYFEKAKAENYPARSVYKLKELDGRFGLLKSGLRVLDLGASPGSWSLYAAQRVGPQGSVTAVDLNPPAREIPGVRWLIADVAGLEAGELIRDGSGFDLVLSDMAPRTTGHKGVDAARSMELARTAFSLAGKVLVPHGAVVVKVFMGPDFQELIMEVRSSFKRSKSVKPKASLKQSRETFLIAWEPNPGIS